MQTIPVFSLVVFLFVAEVGRLRRAGYGTEYFRLNENVIKNDNSTKSANRL